VRFAGQLGFRLAAETKGLARELSPRYSEIAVERVWGEWRRLARTAEHWPEALAALVDSGWDRHVAALSQTRGIPQDPAWHAEGDVFTHLGLAAREAALAAGDLSPEDREVVVLAALLHDVGKVTHTVVTPQRITSSGHAEAGVEPARALLRDIGAPVAVITRILPLIREHMAHVSVQGTPSRPAARRLARRLALSGASIVDWACVVDADCAGRVPAKRSPAADWLRVADLPAGAPAPSLLRGEHLIALGLAPGPVFSEILRAAAAAQDDEVFSDVEGALRWVDARLSDTRRDGARP
jgi:tRNA nucleotidyltransferase (CCA-adding enzyme)